MKFVVQKKKKWSNIREELGVSLLVNCAKKEKSSKKNKILQNFKKREKKFVQKKYCSCATKLKGKKLPTTTVPSEIWKLNKKPRKKIRKIKFNRTFFVSQPSSAR